MKLTVIGLVALGLLAAISAAVLVGALRVKQPSAVVVDPSTVETEVVVARRDLPALSVVPGDAVEIRSVPLSELPPNALRSAQAVVGKVLMSPMLEGQSFSRANFARDGSGVHLASVLQEGFRAMSVTLQDASGLDGLLYPGSIVDVMASFRMAVESNDGSVRGGDLISTVLLEAIQVLAIEDQTIVSGEVETDEDSAPAKRMAGTRRRMVTLLVDPRQAEALQLAAGHGTIALALRNPLDLAGVGKKGTSFLDLAPLSMNRVVETGSSGEGPSQLHAPPPPVVAAAPEPEEREEPKPPAWQTVVIRGSNTVTQSFEDDAPSAPPLPSGATRVTERGTAGRGDPSVGPPR